MTLLAVLYLAAVALTGALAVAFVVLTCWAAGALSFALKLVDPPEPWAEETIHERFWLRVAVGFFGLITAVGLALTCYLFGLLTLDVLARG